MQVLWRGMVQMKKFEYKRMYREVGDRELAMIGEVGWELVAVEPSKLDLPPTLWFKRDHSRKPLSHILRQVYWRVPDDQSHSAAHCCNG